MPHFNQSTRAIQAQRVRWLAACAGMLWFAGCGTFAPPKSVAPPPVAIAPPPSSVQPVPAAPALRQAAWADLPGWPEENAALAWEAFLASCGVLGNQPGWGDVCTAALRMNRPDPTAARRFFESNFTPLQLINPDGSSEGLVTGYYEPLLHGSRKPSRRYRFPLYAVPDDLLVVDLAELHPGLKDMRLRGRLEGRRVVPYFDREQIENGKAAVRGKEIAWVDDAIDLFFLQVQGSGRIQLDSGEVLRVGYADHNGHPYRSIGRWLAERGELPLEKASMQGIKEWVRQNPARLTELLNHNASYVFFRELPGNLRGPLGALGVPLSAQRSVAVDPRFVPLGAPVFLATTWPNSGRPLHRLMLAQDTGSAIRGAVRADFFWGFGEEAAREAGRMKQSLRMWVLLPKGLPPPANGAELR